jgi:Thioesterase-like superfamily
MSTEHSGPTMTEFERCTAVRQVAPGQLVADIDPGWGIPVGPNGGYVAAVVVRALEAQLNLRRDRRLRSLICHYLRSPAMGTIELEVVLLRSGRRLSTGRLTAHQDGKEVLIAWPRLPFRTGHRDHLDAAGTECRSGTTPRCGRGEFGGLPSRGRSLARACGRTRHADRAAALRPPLRKRTPVRRRRRCARQWTADGRLACSGAAAADRCRVRRPVR